MFPCGLIHWKTKKDLPNTLLFMKACLLKMKQVILIPIWWWMLHSVLCKTQNKVFGNLLTHSILIKNVVFPNMRLPLQPVVVKATIIFVFKRHESNIVTLNLCFCATHVQQLNHLLVSFIYIMYLLIIFHVLKGKSSRKKWYSHFFFESSIKWSQKTFHKIGHVYSH